MTPPDFVERFIDLPDLRMHYVEAGPPDGESVILLHGFPEFWYSWRFQIPALAAAGFRVIAPDQRGYNLTAKQGPYLLDTLTADIAHLQDALGLSSSYIAGHDWGGVVAYAFAARLPGRTRKLAVLNAPHLNVYLEHTRRFSRQVRLSWYVYYFQIPWLVEWTLRRRNYEAMRAAFRSLPADLMTPVDLQRYVEAWSQPGALSAMVGWYRQNTRAMLRARMRVPRQDITAETLVIWGERDFALEKSLNDDLPKYIPHVRVHYLPQASHWVQMHAPNEVNALLLDFWAGP